MALYEMEHDLRMHAYQTKLLEAHAHKHKLDKISKKHSRTPEQIAQLVKNCAYYAEETRKSKNKLLAYLASV